MDSNQFRFSEAQRRALALHMKLLPVDPVQSFLNRCEYAIAEWQADWPVEKMMEGNKGAGDQLRAVSTALLQARCEIMKLQEGASAALWIRLHEVQTAKNTTKPWAVRDAYLLRLLELAQMASTLADDFRAGGVVKYCERDLVDRLVQAFIDSSFNRVPSAAPNGIFMHFLGELENMLTLPGGKKLTLGKDIVAASIECHKQQAAQLEQWQAGMYEFTTKPSS